MYDIIIASDLRFPGGTSHSIAEEITAQHQAGYRTGLVQLNGPLVRTLHPVNKSIRRRVLGGVAELIVGADPVRTKVLVLRHPAVAQHALAQAPPIETEHVVVVANAGPEDIDGQRHYEPALVDQAVRRHVGRDPVWAPIGPLVRQELVAHVPGERMATEDWVNIIDVDAWAVERPDWVSDRPVIGRHSRHSPQKWPADAATLRAVYPVDGSWTVRILGGAEPAAELLGTIPPSWDVKPFGAMTPKEFLATLDFFVYYHDPRWVEAFGRTILEAMASGAVAVLPPHFETLFADAARYAEPDQVRQVVNELWADRDAYLQQAEYARAMVRSRFGHEAHADRIAALIGPGTAPADVPEPSDGQVPVAVGAERSERPAMRRPRVLLMSSNGAGMGHLTRLLAYARHLNEEFEPYFVSMSQAAPVVGQFGFRYEYLPSTGALGMAPAAWQKLMVKRLTECLARVRPEVVVFDGTWPYNGFPMVRDRFPHLPWVWSRRGMWRKGANAEQVHKRSWFDEVIEPGDFAAEYDHGATRADPSTKVGPVTLVDRDELEERDAARTALGLPLDRPVGLISLGAGNINDTSSDTGAAVAALRALDMEVCLSRPAIAAGASHNGVHVVRDYPLARRYSAFDVVVSAAGYNSFQELMRMSVPNLLVPNTQTALDDQAARAAYAVDQGWSHSVDRVVTAQVQPLLADLLQHGTEMVGKAAAQDPGNGAPAAARRIADVARRGSTWQ